MATRPNAERKGGWVDIVLHVMCTDCGPHSMDPAIHDAFLAWLAPRRERGTVVRTVHEMIGGTRRPVPPPAPSAPERAGGNLIANGSLEENRRGIGADCFTMQEPFAWSRTPDAFDGASALVYRPGTSDSPVVRRLDSTRDMGGCAPTVSSLRTYRASARYRSASPVVLVVAYRDADGYWNGWKNSKPFPASPDGFAEAAWTLPALPREAQALGIGVNVVEDREATVDGFSLVEQ